MMVGPPKPVSESLSTSSEGEREDYQSPRSQDQAAKGAATSVTQHLMVMILACVLVMKF